MKPNAEINLTSLLDVAFVLLIAFMLVAPSLKYGVDLQLPSMKEGAPQLTTDQQSLSTIVITRQLASASTGGVKTFLLDGEAVELSELEARLKTKRDKLGAKLSVEIQADKDVPYEAFVQAVGAVRRAGVEAVGLPVDTTAVDGVPATR